MMRLRQLVWATLPAAVLAAFTLAPGLSAAAPAKHHKATSTSSHAVAKPVSKRATARRKTTQKVAVRRRRSSRYRTRFGPSPTRIGQIQQALARTGFYSGDPTGSWDSQTIEAMKSFQQAHNLPPTGKINATTLQELGLGSDIAGLAPPRPQVGAAPSGSSE